MTLAAGDRLGRYALVEKLGAGAMGEVWTADDPELGRQVAIKVLRDELTVFSERLRREARAMAQLDHLGVLQVHDVGEADGRVYIAMELVDGQSVREWLATPRTWREIVTTFIAAGRGLDAVHAAGLVHRDVKPDNVLVARNGRVAVGDFGIARFGPGEDGVGKSAAAAATSGESVETVPGGTDRRTTAAVSSPAPVETLTAAGDLVGTPAYMAPELHQERGATAASDQFAFCVALWEALYGRRPFYASDDGLAPAVSVGFAIVSGRMTPPPASVRLPRWLRRTLQRGLASDPSARFPSMRALVTTLERGLTRRRNALLAGAAVAVLALTAGAAVVVAGGGGDRRPRCKLAAAEVDRVWNAAARARIEASFGANRRAHVPATIAQVTSELDRHAAALGDARIAACEATHVRGEQSPAALDRRMACLDHQADELGALAALFGAGDDNDLVDTAPEAVASLDDPSDCVAAARNETAPPASAIADRVAAARRALADVRAQFATGKFPAARTAIEPVASAARELGYAPLTAEVLLLRGKIIAELGDAAAGEQALQEAAVAAAAAGDDARVADALLTQLELQTDQGGKPTGALERLGPAEVAVTRAGRPALREQFLVARSGVQYMLGHYDEARVDLEAALTSRRARVGDKSVETAQIRMRLADTLGKAGKRDAAIAEVRESLALYEAALGPDHPKVGRVLDSLAMQLTTAGKYDEARTHGERSLAIVERALGPESPLVANALNTLASIAQNQGRTDDQAALNERALAIREKVLGPEHPSVANSLSNLAIARRRQGRVDEALALQDRAQTIREKTLGPDHPSIANMLLTRATILNQMKRYDEALVAATRALAIREKSLGPDHNLTAWAHGTVGGVLQSLGRKREACAEFDTTIAILEKVDREQPDLSAWLPFQIGCLLEADHTREALAAAEHAIAIGEKSGQDPMQLAPTRFLLGQALWETGGDRRRAVEQVRLAHSVYAAGSAHSQEEAKPLAAWLAKHRAPP